MTTQTTQMTAEEIKAAGYETASGDFSLDILAHTPDGEKFLARYESVWTTDGQECVGLTISRLYGPLHYSEVEAMRSNAELARDYIGNQSDYQAAEDGEWANEQEWGHIATIEQGR